MADRRGFEPRTLGLGGRCPVLARLPVQTCDHVSVKREGYLKFTVEEERGSVQVIDEVDRKILGLLQKDGRLSYREIAKELNIAVGTVHNRIKRMEENGVLQGIHPKIDYEKVGYGLTAIIGIQAQGKKIIEIEKEIAKDRHVMCVYDVTGIYDIIVIAKFEGREDMNHFVKTVLSIDGVEKTTTHVALQIVKEDFNLGI